MASVSNTCLYDSSIFKACNTRYPTLHLATLADLRLDWAVSSMLDSTNRHHGPYKSWLNMPGGGRYFDSETDRIYRYML